MEVPELLEPYVNDYKINIREIAWLSDEQIASFKSDFRYVAEFFKLKRLKQNLKFDDKVPAHIDAILKLLTALSGDKEYTEILKTEGGKPKTMCEMIERLQAGLKAEIAELKQEKAATDKENAKLKQKKAATDKENAELKQKKAATDKENAKLKQEIAFLKAALAAKG